MSRSMGMGMAYLHRVGVYALLRNVYALRELL
jgi:hypothetical protein